MQIAIDDFGTGYSSLARLISLPLQGVKVDREFVDKIDSSDESPRTLLRTMLTMLADLGLAVTAEGVETDSQRQWLIKNGVSRAQGYLFSKPLTLSEAIERLRQIHYRPKAIPVKLGRSSIARRRRLRAYLGWPFRAFLAREDRRSPPP